MSPYDALEANLLDLLHELSDESISLIVGGGYGVYLKQQHIKRSGARTLLQELPTARSTNDIDIFLRTELLADRKRSQALAGALKRMGCESVDAAKHFQFSREKEIAGQRRKVKFDLLTGPIDPSVDETKLDINPPRVRPAGKAGVGLHGRLTDEALGIEQHPLAVELSGMRTNGQAYAGQVYLPQPFTYALMKLHALRDRKDDSEKDYGRHHALDLYTIIGMATEEEWKAAKNLRQEHGQAHQVESAREIVRTHFASEASIGFVRMREHSEYRTELQTDAFRHFLHELLGLPSV
jgi:hypothetical protein